MRVRSSLHIAGVPCRVPIPDDYPCTIGGCPCNTGAFCLVLGPKAMKCEPASLYVFHPHPVCASPMGLGFVCLNADCPSRKLCPGMGGGAPLKSS
jgi:hypothetical protein